MGLLSNISALAHPLFKRGATKAVSKPRAPLRNFLGGHAEPVDRELASRIKKDAEMMRRHGINFYED